MDSFRKYLEFSLKNISPEIISGENKEVILDCTEFLPDTFSYSVFGYEKKLRCEEGNADLAVSASENRPLPLNFNSAFSYPELKKLTDEKPEWRRLKEWASLRRAELDEGKSVPEVICLEFDFDSLFKGDVTPSLFLGIEKNFNLNNPENKNQLFERLNVFSEGIGMLSGSPVNPETNSFMRDTSEKIFPEHSLFQAGVMLSRGNSPVRVCLKRFTKEKLLHVLDDLIPETEIRDGIRETVDKYGAFFDHFALSLDVLRGVIVKGGVECYYFRKRQPAYEKRWGDVMALLVKDDFCKENMMDLILRFPRKVGTEDVPELKSASGPPDFYAQALHHLKFTPGAGKDAFAKVYLWAGYNRSGTDK